MRQLNTDTSSEASVIPRADLVAAIRWLNEEMARAGASGTRRAVTDGPFAETKQ